MNTADLLRTIRRIDIQINGVSHQRLSGLFNSAFRGRGLTFDAVRRYEPGDDVRTINWNLTARYREPYVSTFREEKERLIWLIVDMSGSTSFGSGGRTKHDLTTEVAALIAYSALQNNDRVGLILFNGDKSLNMPPARGMAQFWKIANELIGSSPVGATHLNDAFTLLGQIEKKRGIVFIISDFIDSPYDEAVKRIEKQHELVPVRIYDLADRDFPDIGWAKLHDPETDHSGWVNTSSEQFRKQRRISFDQNDAYFRSTFNRTGHLSIHTSENYVGKMVDFLNHRR